MQRPQAILFDVDGILIRTGGAGARSWRWAFQELYGIPADIGEFTDAGMTDPVVGRLTFAGAVGREPSPEELARLLSHYLLRLPEEVAHSAGYTVLAGVAELLPRLCRAGFLLGITTGALEAAAHIKLAHANLNRFFSGGYGSDSADRGELTRRAIERAGRSWARHSTRAASSSSATHRRTSPPGTARRRSPSGSQAVTTARRNCVKREPSTCSGPCSRMPGIPDPP